MSGITLKQVHGIEGRIGSVLLGSDLTKEEVEKAKRKLSAISTEVGSLIIARIRWTEPGQKPSKLIINPDGSISLRAEINRDRTDEDLVAEARKAGLWVNDSIRTDRRIDFAGRTKMQGIETVTMEVTKTIPDGEVWKTKKVLSSIGDEGLFFDLADLIEFVEYRDELLEAGVKFITAFGARFRDASGCECVAYIGLDYRDVGLSYFEHDWNDYACFGRSCK